MSYQERINLHNKRIEEITEKIKQKVIDEEIRLEPEINLAYVKQMDMFDSISGIRKVSERDYSDAEMQRLEKILINLTEGDNG